MSQIADLFLSSIQIATKRNNIEQVKTEKIYC